MTITGGSIPAATLPPVTARLFGTIAARAAPARGARSRE